MNEPCHRNNLATIADRDHSSARGDGDRKVAEGTLKGIKADGVFRADV